MVEEEQESLPVQGGGLGFGEAEGKEPPQEQEAEQQEEELKPWEQHSAVISIPRYDYRAPSSLLESSHSGFLITCPIKREKSATKEAIPILEKFIGSMCSNTCPVLESCSTNKKRKVLVGDRDAESVCRSEVIKDSHSSETPDTTEEVRLPSAETSDNVNSVILSLVKLTRSGLLLFSFPSNRFRHVVGILSNILEALQSGNLKRPLWCNRIFPIQETCILTEKNLKMAVSKLVQEYLGEEQKRLEMPIKFAVGYNRRGIEETELKNLKSTEAFPLLDRDTCFKIVAGAFKDVAKNSLVDLKSPEVAVFVEVLPLSRAPLGSIVAGVSILPHELITTKPRLGVKPLVLDTKPMKKTG